MEFEKAFLATYRSFTTPELLFDKITQRYEVPASIPQYLAERIRARILVLLKNWIQSNVRRSLLVREKEVVLLHS